MAINTTVPSREEIIARAHYLASLGNDEGARKAIGLLELNESQRNKIEHMIAEIGRYRPERALPTSLLHMPQDTLGLIFGSLSVRDIFTCFSVCNTLHQMTQKAVQNEILFENIYRRDYKTPTSNPSLGYLQLCKEAYVSRQNIIDGMCSQPADLPFNPRDSALHEGKLYMVFGNELVKAFDLKTGRALDSDFIEQNDVPKPCAENTSPKQFHRLAASDGKLCAGFTGGIKIWDLKTGKCLSLLEEGFEGIIDHLAISGELLCSCSKGIYKIWDLKTKKRLYSFEEIFSGKPIISNSDKVLCHKAGFEIKIRDLSNGDVLHTLDTGTAGVCSLLIFERKLISQSGDNTFAVWDLKTGKCLCTLSGHTGVVLDFSLFHGLLCSSSLDRTVKFWGLDTKQCLQTIRSKDAGFFRASFNGKLYLQKEHWDPIEVMDFMAKERVIFNEIMNLLRYGMERPVKKAMERFSQISQKIRDKIYRELCLILGIPTNDLKRGEHAFHFDSSPEERFQAIKNYLKSKYPK